MLDIPVIEDSGLASFTLTGSRIKCSCQDQCMQYLARTHGEEKVYRKASDFPKLETERLALRAITPDDRFAIFENYSNPDVAEWFFDKAFTQVEQVDQVIQEFIGKTTEGKGLAWAIVLKETDEFVGTCSYENFKAEGQGEIGFDLAKKHWGHGYMTEALGAIITYGFAVLGLASIEAHTYSRNARARQVLERLGFRVDAIREDSHCYKLARTEWMGIRR